MGREQQFSPVWFRKLREPILYLLLHGQMKERVIVPGLNEVCAQSAGGIDRFLQRLPVSAYADL
jgi:hypothetical protein